MSNKQSNWEEEFAEEANKLSRAEPGEEVYFGIVQQAGNEIFRTPDWWSVKDFITKVEKAAYERGVREALEDQKAENLMNDLFPTKPDLSSNQEGK